MSGITLKARDGLDSESFVDPKALFDLSGKAALVTGATRGIGRAIAETLAAYGAKVVVSSRKAGACDEAVAAIAAHGGEAAAVPANMSRPAEVDALAEQALAAFGRLDILVCNAAVNPHFGPMAEVGHEAYDKIMTTNVKHNLWLCNAVLPDMAARRDGAVIIVSSIGGFKGHEKLGIYGLSKAADMQLARNLAVEWGGRNIRANCIAPGIVKTDMARVLWEDPERHAQAVRAYPIGRLGEPMDIAPLALLLASPAGAWITGQTLTVDGGATIAMGAYS